MRIDEFASAEEQLALWKLVSDNVWNAIATQAEQERRARAEKAARSKPKRGKRKSSPTAAKPAPPKSPTPTKPAADTDSKVQQQATMAQQPINVAPVQPPGPFGATGVQSRAPIQPIAPVATSGAVPQVQQPVPKQQKPRIMARAGGMTV